MVQQQYHANGQVSQSKQGQFTLDYTFNEQGKRSLLTLPDGQKVTYQYNEQGLLSELALVDELNSQNNLLTLEYDVFGLMEKQYLGNGITLSQEHDAQSRLTKQSWLTTSEASQQRTYQYDKQNQLIAVNEFQQTNDDEKQQPTTQHFIYNKISQLVNSHTSQSETTKENKVTEHNNAESYQWDAFGNPKVDLSIPESEREIIVKSDRLHCFSGIDFSYDKSGNQISSIATGIIQKRSFDGLNQLRKISHNEKQTHYQYDALGRRIAKITESGKTDFIWDGNQLIGEHVNGQYTWYIYLPESFLPVALIKDNQVYYYHLDQLGTPVCLTNQAQDIVWENNTDLFGAENKALVINNDETQTVNLIDNPLRFQGQYFDEESGLHYNRFRYYCPTQRRFVHQDPIGLAGGINHYQYAPNPINWVDPYGLCTKEEISTGDRLYASTGYIGGVTKKAGDDLTGAVEYVAANPQKSLYAVDNAIGSLFAVVVDAGEVGSDYVLAGVSGKTLLSSAKGIKGGLNVSNKLIPNPQDIRLASKSWSPVKKARFDIADNYYSNVGYKDYDNHLRGINFDNPVEIINIPKNEKLYQYSYLDKLTGKPKVGSYFYNNTSVDVSKLGFEVNGRKMIEVEINNSDSFLKSTAANIEDWNGSGDIFPGGEIQLFNPNINFSGIKVL